MRLYLDDLRPTPTNGGYTHSPKTAHQAIDLLKTGQVEFISFDHDLGPPEAGTGYDVALWIEREAYTNPDFVVPDWLVHSANPVGSVYISRAMKSAGRARNE